MLTRDLLFLISLYYLVITASESWRPYAVVFTNISTYSLVNYIETNSSISNSGSISVHLNFRQDVSNMYAKTVITLLKESKNFDLEFINKTINVCEFFKNRKYEPILQVLYKVLNKAGSFPSRCPIRKVYFIKDVLVDSEDLPPIMPSSKDIVEITLMTKSGHKFKTIAGIIIHYEVLPK